MLYIIYDDAAGRLSCYVSCTCVFVFPLFLLFCVGMAKGVVG